MVDGVQRTNEQKGVYVSNTMYKEGARGQGEGGKG